MALLLKIEGSAISHLRSMMSNSPSHSLFRPVFTTSHLRSQFFQSIPHWHFLEANDTMSLTINGRAFEETIPAKDIQALVFCSEGAIVPPYSNGYIPYRLPKLLRHSNPGRNFVFELPINTGQIIQVVTLMMFSSH